MTEKKMETLMKRKSLERQLVNMLEIDYNVGMGRELTATLLLKVMGEFITLLQVISHLETFVVPEMSDENIKEMLLSYRKRESMFGCYFEGLDEIKVIN